MSCNDAKSIEMIKIISSCGLP